MNLLLDTHVFLWAMMDTEKLSALAKYELQNPENTASISAISFWEIGMKHSLGKLELLGFLPSALPEIASRKMGFKLLGLDVETASRFGDIPKLHGDPFDRMLIHQAVQTGSCLVSADRQFTQYRPHGLKLLW
ncbi:MAG: type II toxin-antitoxin system VapC family toxin [Verrucomicrobiota bacterium]